VVQTVTARDDAWLSSLLSHVGALTKRPLLAAAPLLRRRPAAAMPPNVPDHTAVAA
jgi:hypothetical protein